MEKHRAWWEPTPEERVASTNQALALLSCRLVPRQEPGWDYPFYDLCRKEISVGSDLVTVWPGGVTNSGDDFALLAEDPNGPTLLIHRGYTER